MHPTLHSLLLSLRIVFEDDDQENNSVALCLQLQPAQKIVIDTTDLEVEGTLITGFTYLIKATTENNNFFCQEIDLFTFDRSIITNATTKN